MTHFVLHVHSTTCRRCGASSQWSHLYEAETKGLALVLHPVETVPFGAPITVQQVRAGTLPLCHLCVSNREVLDGDAVAAAWEAAKRKKLRELQEAPTRVKPSKPAPTLDDLA